MDASFWIGAGMSGALSLLASVFANIYHSRIIEFLDNRKIVSHTKRKKNAIKFNSIVVQLHNGERDKYFYMARIVSGIVISFVFATTSVASCLIIMALGADVPDYAFPLPSHITPLLVIRLVYVTILLFSSLFGFFVAVISMRRFREITSALENFETYQAHYRAKWG
jgi:hypothetical protein